MRKFPHDSCRGSDFVDLGFPPAEAAEPTVTNSLITTIGDTIREWALTQAEAAALSGTDQFTLSKALRGQIESVTIDRMAAWLNALMQTV